MIRSTFSWMLGISLAALVSSCASTTRVEHGGEAAPVWRQSPQPQESFDLLRLRVKTVASENGATFANRFDTAVKSRLLCPEVKMEERGAVDFQLTFRPAVTLFDQTGESFLYTCEVEMTLRDAVGNRTFATRTLSLKGNRTFGQVAALGNLAEQAAADAAEWANRELRQTATETLVAANLAIALPKSLWEKITASRKEKSDSARVLEVAGKLGTLPGVVACELLSCDHGNGVANFRIVYFREEYPAGILDTANAAFAE